MDKNKAKIALARLDAEIATVKNKIASLNQDKQKLKADINRISASKKDRLNRLQKEINNISSPQYKKSKRANRENEKKHYDSQINSGKKQLEKINSSIADHRKEISEFELIKKRIRFELSKK